MDELDTVNKLIDFLDRRLKGSIKSIRGAKSTNMKKFELVNSVKAQTYQEILDQIDKILNN